MNNSGSAEDAIPLSHLLAADAVTLPLSANVVKGIPCGRESLYDGQRLTILYVEESPVVRFNDGHGRCFHEPASLDVCRFMLLPDLAANDGKTYATVAHVMRNPDILPRLVRAANGYSLGELGSEDIEEGDVLEVGTSVVTRCGMQCVLWVRLIEEDESGRPLSNAAREPVYMPLEADCEFHAAVDKRRYALADIVRMVEDRREQLPLRVEIVLPDEQVYNPAMQAVPSKLVGRKLKITALPTRRSVIASTGMYVLRIPETLCDDVTVSESSCQMESNIAVGNVASLASCVDASRIRTVGPPEPASITSQVAGAGDRDTQRRTISRTSSTSLSAKHFQTRVSESDRNRLSSPVKRILSRSRIGSIHINTNWPEPQMSLHGEDTEDEEYVEPASAGLTKPDLPTYHEINLTGCRDVQESTSPLSPPAPVDPRLSFHMAMRPAMALPSEKPVAASQRSSLLDEYEEMNPPYVFTKLKPTVKPDGEQPDTQDETMEAFDEDNYAIMDAAASEDAAAAAADAVKLRNVYGGLPEESQTAMTNIYTVPTSSNQAAGGNSDSPATNIYSTPPPSRRMTHESVMLKLPLKEKSKKGRAPQPPSHPPHMPKTVPRNSVQASSASDESVDTMYMNVPDSDRVSSSYNDTAMAKEGNYQLLSKAGDEKSSSSESLHKTVSMPIAGSQTMPRRVPSPLVARRQDSKSATTSPHHLAQSDAESDGAAERAPRHPKPKPRKTVSSSAINVVSKEGFKVTSPTKPLRPERNQKLSLSEQHIASAAAVEPTADRLDVEKKVLAKGYVEIAKHEALVAELEAARRKLQVAEKEVEQLKYELERRKAVCKCVSRDEARRLEGYEFTLPRNIPVHLAPGSGRRFESYEFTNPRNTPVL